MTRSAKSGTLGESLRRARLARRLTLAEVERLTGLDLTTINGYERSKRMPPADRLVLLARLYGVSLDELAKGFRISDESSASELEAEPSDPTDDRSPIDAA